jgi:subtilisin family serine protease
MNLKSLTRGALCAASLAAIAAFATTGASAQTTPEELSMVADSYIFVFRDHVAPGQARALAAQAAANAGGNVTHVYSHAIKGFSAKMSATAAARLAANNPNIAYYEADKIVRIVAPPVGAKKGKPAPTQPSQTTPWGIARVNGVANYAGSNRAWVIDTGIDLDHPDLNVDTARAANFSTGSSANDGNGHGSHVSGTIAACNNSLGVIGVAPCAPVVPVRVLNNAGSGTTSGVIAGVDYVAANGAPGDVANMSLGGGVSATLDQAVINAAATGVKFALAAGNESDNANNHSPARANGANIFTISAFSQGDNFASFSNFGNPPVDFGDPGVSVFSTYKDGGYATLSGTSMATPHAAGVLLLGACRSGGTVNGDPDGNPDTICVH